MNIYINSKKIALDKNLSLQEVLEINGLTSNHFAVAVNRIFVRRESYLDMPLNEGDEIDVVLPMQGG